MGLRLVERLTDYRLGALALGRRLLGLRLVRIDHLGRRTAGVIVETEAYVGPDDLASHTAGGRRTARNASMYLPGGHAYVYFVYGMHWCFNVVAEGERGGEAVLIRGLRPTEGLDLMAARRGRHDPRTLCAGPARLAQALAIDRSLDGADLRAPGPIFIEGSPSERPEVLATSRVGVDSAGEWADRPWRFLLAGQEAWWSKAPSGPLVAADRESGRTGVRRSGFGRRTRSSGA